MTGDRTIVAEQQDEPQPAADAGTEPAVPYEFSAEHVPFAVEAVDRALSEGGDTWTAALAVSTADAGEDLGDPAALRRELLLPGIQNADEGGIEDADVVMQERPAGGVPAGRWSVRCRRWWARCRGC